MKRIIIFLFLLLAFPIISALEINMDSQIPQGQTIIASVYGNFLDSITKNNIQFYRGHVRTSFDYDVAKIGDLYYIYALSGGKLPNNYSIIIKNVRYMDGAQVSQQEISKNFTITNDTADFSLNPGFVITDGNFSLKIQDLQSSDITINIETEINSGGTDGSFNFIMDGQEAGDSIILHSGQIKNIKIILDDLTETTIRTIRLSTDNLEYDIPIYVILGNFTGSSAEENESEINQTNNPPANETNEEEDNETDDGIVSEPDYEIIIKDNKTVAVKNGEIIDAPATSKTCLQIKGDICSQEEICQNQTIYAKDAKCCISKCVKQEEKKNTKIIGWIIIAVIFIVILWFFRIKFRGMKRKKDLLLDNNKRK